MCSINNVLGRIKYAQKSGYEENYISTDFSQVDFATVAKGFRQEAIRFVRWKN